MYQKMDRPSQFLGCFRRICFLLFLERLSCNYQFYQVDDTAGQVNYILIGIVLHWSVNYWMKDSGVVNVEVSNYNNVFIYSFRLFFHAVMWSLCKSGKSTSWKMFPFIITYCLSYSMELLFALKYTLSEIYSIFNTYINYNQ